MGRREFQPEVSITPIRIANRGSNPRHPALPPSHQQLIRLQRVAGNSAVASLVEIYAQSRHVAHLEPLHPSTPANQLRDRGDDLLGKPGDGLCVQRNGTGLAATSALEGAKENLGGPLGDNELWANPPKDQYFGKDLAERRVNLLANPLKGTLEGLGIPWPVPIVGHELLVSGSTYAAFNPALWIVMMSAVSMSNDHADGKMRIGIAGSLYHELRHAEQFFRMARLLAGQNLKAEDIQAKLNGMRPDVVELAMKNPLKLGKKKSKKGKEKAGNDEEEVSEAKGWLEFLHLYMDVQESLKKTHFKYTQSLEAFRLHQTSETAAAVKYAAEEYRGIYVAYHLTAVEKDAWAVAGELVTKLGGTPDTMEAQLSKLPSLRSVSYLIPTESVSSVEEPEPSGVPSQWLAGRVSRPAVPPALLGPGTEPSPAPAQSSRRNAVRLPAGLVPLPDLQKQGEDVCQRHAMPVEVGEVLETIGQEELPE